MDRSRQNPLAPETAVHLSILASRDLELCEAAVRMLQADQGKLFPVDVMAVAALNRAAGLLSGFVAMISSRNLVCAVAILRLQLDTALRLSALSLADRPHALAEEVMKGTPLRKLKDRDGTPMTDNHLVTVFSKQAPWIEDVYNLGCAYVHFGNTHVGHAFSAASEPGRASVRVGATDPDDFSESNYHEAIRAFTASLDFLLHVVESWTSAKSGREPCDEGGAA
jgi:hypothetical protein